MTRSRAEIIRSLTKPGIVAVVRTPETSQVLPVCEALLAGGIHAIEITMTVPNALTAIREAAGRYGDRALIGVGTVLDGATATAAIQAGAEFVVSPITKVEIINAAHAADRPVMMGAYTPTEAQTAHEAGADFIKLFPADGLGAGYIKALRAPLPHLKIVPTGGVDLSNAAAMFEAGCAALGLGSSLVAAKWVKEGNWSEITKAAQAYVAIARQCGR